MNELKSCPFCGASNIIENDEAMVCCNCLSEGPSYGYKGKTDWDTWNTRPIEEKLAQENKLLRAVADAAKEQIKYCALGYVHSKKQSETTAMLIKALQKLDEGEK